MSENRASTKSKYRGDWATPWDIFYSIQDSGFPFALDVAASQENAKCMFFYTAKENALTQRWAIPRGKFWWCNPDFRLAEQFLAKAYDEMMFGNHGIMLLPPSMETEWFRQGVTEKGLRVLHYPKRIQFIDPRPLEEQTDNGNNKGSALIAFTHQKRLPRVANQPWWKIQE